MYSGINFDGWGLLLLAMGVGYLICLKASKENTKLFQYAGYVIGMIMIVSSFILSLFNTFDTIEGVKRVIRRARRTSIRSSRTDRTQQNRDTRIQRQSPDLSTKVNPPRQAIGVGGDRTESDTER